MIDVDKMATEIENVLKTITDLKETHDYEPHKLTQLPAATIFFDGFSQSDETSRRKHIIWRWIIRAYIPLRTDVAKPQREMRSMYAKVLNAFMNNPSINNSCLYHTVDEGDVLVQLDKNNPHLIGEFRLNTFTHSIY